METKEMTDQEVLQRALELIRLSTYQLTGAQIDEVATVIQRLDALANPLVVDGDVSSTN